VIGLVVQNVFQKRIIEKLAPVFDFNTDY